MKTKWLAGPLKTTTLLTVAILFLTLRCQIVEDNVQPKSELEKLPLATREGKKTFGCLVNGKAWIPRSSIDFFATDALVLYQAGVLQIWASVDEKGRHQAMSFTILNGVEAGVSYDLTMDPTNGAVFSSQLPEGLCDYDFDRTLSGKLRITKFDEVKGIIAADFEFATSKPNCDTIIVTDGRFDLLLW